MSQAERGKYFAYSHNEIVEIAVSGEQGRVVARCDSIDGSDAFLVRYKTTTGTATERWFPESALRYLEL